MSIETESIRSLATLPSATCLRVTMLRAADEIDALRDRVTRLEAAIIAMHNSDLMASIIKGAMSYDHKAEADFFATAREDGNVDVDIRLSFTLEAAISNVEGM